MRKSKLTKDMRTHPMILARALKTSLITLVYRLWFARTFSTDCCQSASDSSSTILSEAEEEVPTGLVIEPGIPWKSFFNFLQCYYKLQCTHKQMDTST